MQTRSREVRKTHAPRNKRALKGGPQPGRWKEGKVQEVRPSGHRLGHVTVNPEIRHV